MPRFLTDEWFDAIEIVLQEAAPSDGPDTWINVIVRDTNGVAPHANIGMTEEITVRRGHVVAADATLTLPFELARRLLVNGNSAAGVVAFLMGRVQMVGDVAKLAALQGRIDHLDVTDLWSRVSALTD